MVDRLWDGSCSCCLPCSACCLESESCSVALYIALTMVSNSKTKKHNSLQLSTKKRFSKINRVGFKNFKKEEIGVE